MQLNQNSTREPVKELSYKLGCFSVYLGAMLFLNLLFFFRGKRKGRKASNSARPITN